MRSKFVVFFLLSMAAFAGQSLRLNGSQTATNTSVAAQGANSQCRFEFQLTLPSGPAAGRPADVSGCGIDFTLNSGTFIQIMFNRTIGFGTFYDEVPISLFVSNWLMARCQLIPSGAGGTITFEFWDINGKLVHSLVEPYTGTSGSNSSGAFVGSTGSQDSSWGFFRLDSRTVPVGSAEPTFADNGNLLEWKFNGTLDDSSGHGYTATSSAGTPATSCGSAPCYEPTSGQTLVTAVIKATPTPFWGYVPTWRAGTTVGLDGSASVSMGDTDTTPALFWQILSGPSIPVWSSHSSVQPTLTGIVAGNYHVQLVAKNSSGGSAIATADIGAVAQDSNGVVISADPNVEKVFGPMITLGKSPWGWMDERAFAAVGLQKTYLTNSKYNPPEFPTRGAGTIAYKFGGNFGCTTLNGGITATATSITVTNAACLDLSTLPGTPTDIVVEAELIRICSASGNVLTVCYDGRGAARGSYGLGGVTQVAAVSHSSGAAVGDSMTTGTGTKFITDANRPMCPGGAPGFPGPVQYSTGTVTMTANSTTLTGSGTNWTAGNLVFPGQMLRIPAATHGGGTPFVFLSTITAVGGTTSLTMSRPAPADIDASAFSYQVIGAIDASGNGSYFGAWGITIPGTSSTTNIAENVQLCESETRLSSDRYFEGGAMNLTSQSGQTYSWKSFVGVTSGFSLNFYGSGLAQRATNKRSGYAPALDLANNVDDNWVNDPEVAAGFGVGAPVGYTVMGGILGGMIDRVLNGSSPLSWDHLRNFGETAISMFSGANANNCNSGDARTVGSTGAIVAFLALFDTAQQAHWNDYLYNNADSYYHWLTTCKDAVSPNSWANNGGTFNASAGPTITATNGSASITATSGNFVNGGTGFSSCSGGSGSGTATVTAGSDAMTSSGGFVSGVGKQIVINGTRLGSPYTFMSDYRNNSATSNTLGALWPADADSGTVNWSTAVYGNSGAAYITSFGVNQADTVTTLQSFVCTYVDSTHAMLDRPWPFSSGTYHMTTYNIAGTTQQPFMLGGIFSLGLQWGALNANSTIASAFTTLLGDAAGWMFSTGINPNAKAPYYATVSKLYTPTLVPSTNYSAVFINSTVQPGTDTGAVVGFRMLTGEIATTLRAYSESQGGSSAARTWADGLYGALWGRDGYNAGGVYTDSQSGGNNINVSNLNDLNLSGSKYPGFFFGLGMSHQWPALRLGGAMPATPRVLEVTCNISSVANASKCRVTLTKPDGSTVINTCASSPCSVTADAREGDHLLKIEYLNSSNAVLSAGQALPIRMN